MLKNLSLRKIITACVFLAAPLFLNLKNTVLCAQEAVPTEKSVEVKKVKVTKKAKVKKEKTDVQADAEIEANMDSIENEDSKVSLDSVEDAIPKKKSNQKSAQKKVKKVTPNRETSSDSEDEAAAKDQVDYEVIEE